ncbi:MAG: hypothetical protein WAW96_09670 [Alphaproteobacteria bacterium]
MWPRGNRTTRAIIAFLALCAVADIAHAANVPAVSAPAKAADAAPARPAGPPKMTPEQLDKMVPKHLDYLGALAPDNLNKPRPPAPFDVTGTWFIDLSGGFLDFMFGPPYPKFYAAGQQAMKDSAQARAKGEDYRDTIGQCYPAGMPMIMTRVWPIAMIQKPTAIYMISGFMNSLRIIYLDGRKFTDPDLAISTYNGESIGHWEGDTLVVKSKYFEPDQHWIDSGLPISDQFQMTERIRMLDNGKALEIAYTMTDPKNWKGEWKSIKRWNREDHTDIGEVECLPNLNEHLPGTDAGAAAAQAREGKDKTKSGTSP